MGEEICEFEKQTGDQVIGRLCFCRPENSIILGIGVDVNMLGMLADLFNGGIAERLFWTTVIFFHWLT
jgi:hypothetical protein